MTNDIDGKCIEFACDHYNNYYVYVARICTIVYHKGVSIIAILYVTMPDYRI